jgi:hypothetical protein
MTPAEAKFARESKKHPKDWIIVPVRCRGLPTGRFKLVNLGGSQNVRTKS